MKHLWTIDGSVVSIIKTDGLFFHLHAAAVAAAVTTTTTTTNNNHNHQNNNYYFCSVYKLKMTFLVFNFVFHKAQVLE